MTPIQLIVACMAMVIFLFAPHSIVHAQTRIQFFMGERHFIPGNNIYTAQLWVYVAPGYTWRVGNTLLNFLYNTDALVAVNTTVVWDVYPEFQTKGYVVSQSDYGGGTAFSMATFGSDYVRIEGGTAAKLGVMRWQVRDGTQDDNISLIYEDRLDSSILYDSTQRIQYGWGNNTVWHMSYLPPRLIDPETVPCGSQYFRVVVCDSSELPAPTTPTPIQDSCLYWHRIMTPTGVGPHVVYFQYDMRTAPIGSERVFHFLTQTLDSLLDVSRCRWSRQLDAGDLEWRQLDNVNEGAVIRWSVLNTDFAGFPGLFRAVTLHVIHANDRTKIIPASTCGAQELHNGRTEVLLN